MKFLHIAIFVFISASLLVALPLQHATAQTTPQKDFPVRGFHIDMRIQFMKLPALKALAPTQKEPPFLVAQLVVLAIFVGLGIVAAKRFRGASMLPA